MCASAVNGVPEAVVRFCNPLANKFCLAELNEFGLITAPSCGGLVGLSIIQSHCDDDFIF